MLGDRRRDPPSGLDDNAEPTYLSELRKVWDEALITLARVEGS